MQQAFKTSYFKFLNDVNKAVEILICHWSHYCLSYSWNLSGAIQRVARFFETDVEYLLLVLELLSS